MQNVKKGVNDFDWTQIKVIFIAGSFTSYQKDAANNPNLPIELYEAQTYKNGYISLDQIQKTEANSVLSSKVPFKTTKETAINMETVATLSTHTEQSHLLKSSNTIEDLYNSIKDTLFAWDPSFEIKPVKTYIGFKINHQNVIDILPLTKALKVWANVPWGALKDPENIARNMSNKGHWGNGDYEFIMEDDQNLEYILSLLKQAWQIHQTE